MTQGCKTGILDCSGEIPLYEAEMGEASNAKDVERPLWRGAERYDSD